MRLNPLSLTVLLSATVLPQARTASISPYEAESGKAFAVTVSGKTDLCMPIFSHIEANAGTGELWLTAMAENNPLGKCTAGPHDYQLDFDIPALKAGEYNVMVTLKPPCLYQEPRCKIPEFPDSAGTLTVRDSAKLDYHIKPSHTPALKSFRMMVTNKNFKCSDEYLDLSVAVRGWQIIATFTNHPNPQGLCPAVLTDYGPTFTVPALESGTYQVFAAPKPYCASGICPIGLVAPQLAGALEARGQADGAVIWVEPGKVAAGMPATLQLHSTGYTCNDVVQDKQVDVKDGIVTLRYTMTRTKKFCADTIFVHHEDFTAPGLAIGLHPVFIKPGTDCPANSILCGDAAAAKAVDTVHAESSLRLRDAAARGKTPAAGMRMLWRGEPADADGRVRNQPR